MTATNYAELVERLYERCSYWKRCKVTRYEAAVAILALQREIEGLRVALLKAKETIHSWHGDVAWDIYDRASPEMKVMNEALGDAAMREGE